MIKFKRELKTSDADGDIDLGASAGVHLFAEGVDLGDGSKKFVFVSPPLNFSEYARPEGSYIESKYVGGYLFYAPVNKNFLISVPENLNDELIGADFTELGEEEFGFYEYDEGGLIQLRILAHS